MYSRAIASTNTIVRVMHVYKDGVKSTIGRHMVYVVYVHMIFPSCSRSGLFLGVYASMLFVTLPGTIYHQHRISYATYTRYMERILALGAPNRAGPVDLEPKGIK